MTEISREDLYDRVWRIPMRTLATEFGVSDQGLAKICARHTIPRPPRGFLAKKEAGLTVEQQPLPALSDETASAMITITRASPALASATGMSKVARAKAEELPSFKVPESFAGLHWIVAVWVKDHEQAQLERRKQLKAWRPRDFWKPDLVPDLTERDRYRFRMTSALLKALEAQGGKAVSGTIRGQLVLEVSGEKIEMTVIEKMRQTLQKPTKEDQRWTAYPHHHNAALHPTGYLRFTVSTYFGAGGTKQWIETEKKNGAAILGEVVAGLLSIGSALVQLRLQREEARRKSELERERRAELRRLAELDKQRWERLRQAALDWEESKRLRAFLAAVEKDHDAMPDDIDGLPREDWLNWARSKIADLDPLSTVKSQE